MSYLPAQDLGLNCSAWEDYGVWYLSLSLDQVEQILFKRITLIKLSFWDNLMMAKDE